VDWGESAARVHGRYTLSNHKSSCEDLSDNSWEPASHEGQIQRCKESDLTGREGSVGGQAAIRFVQLKGRGASIESRLSTFYCEYYDALLTRRWPRLFLYSSLEDLRIAPTSANGIATHALEILIETAHKLGPAASVFCRALLFRRGDGDPC
jgi:hypothetical protein